MRQVGDPVSSTNKTDILLKVALNTITIYKNYSYIPTANVVGFTPSSTLPTAATLLSMSGMVCKELVVDIPSPSLG